MTQSIHAALKPTRSRQQKLFALRCALVGLTVSAIVGVLLGIVRLAWGIELSLESRLAVLAAGPVGGFLLGLLLQRTWHGAAVAVDSAAPVCSSSFPSSVPSPAAGSRGWLATMCRRAVT